MPSAPRQTLSYLTRRFAEVGIHPQSQHGQNFLIDLNLLDLIVESAQLDENDVVLEVGTGTGSLTARIAERVAEVVTVEIDPRMHLLASEELIDHANVTLLHQDALASKSRLDDAVLNAVRERLEVDPGRRFKLVANLPYNVATLVISNLLASNLIPETMTVTIQKELAERITAPPRTRDYSALSIWIQCQCEASIVRLMPPQVFWPRPKVTSAILHIVHRPDLRARLADPAAFHDTVRALFCHRRKFLRGVVVAVMKGKLTKPQVDDLLAELGFPPTARAEELDIESMIRLCDALRRAETTET